MKILVLDENFIAISVLDQFTSFIWTERYDEYGDFELDAPATEANLSSIKLGRYVWQSESNPARLMVVEEIELTTDPEAGNVMKVKGRSLESILERRIIWPNPSSDYAPRLTIINGSKQNGILQLIRDNAINCTRDTRRNIPHLSVEASSDSYITGLTMDGQYCGENLYEIIKALCKESKIGFRVEYREPNNMVFKLYKGTDRSSSQNALPMIVFSPRFDNLINSTYLKTNKECMNATLVLGVKGDTYEEYDPDLHETITKTWPQRLQDVTLNNASGLARHETFADATDTSHETEDGHKINDTRYWEILKTRGKETLAEYPNKETEAFDGEIDYRVNFKYGEDYYIGDLVEIENEFGISKKVRVTELIFSYNVEDGLQIYPTFTSEEE